MKRNFLYVILCSALFSVSSTAQSPKEEVLQVVKRFFTTMREQDSEGFNALFLKRAHAYSVRNQGDSTLVQSSVLKATPSKHLLEERLREDEISIQMSSNIAAVWAPYDFWIDGQHSHCGYEVFTLIKKNGLWKIASLTYSVERYACNE